MDLIRTVLATVLLLSSTQSLALFMPEEFTISTDTTVQTDSGCGLIVSPIFDSARS